MFVDFPQLGIKTFRIDISKPLEDQEPVDAIFHKLMYKLFDYLICKWPIIIINTGG